MLNSERFLIGADETGFPSCEELSSSSSGMDMVLRYHLQCRHQEHAAWKCCDHLHAAISTNVAGFFTGPTSAAFPIRPQGPLLPRETQLDAGWCHGKVKRSSGLPEESTVDSRRA